MKRHKYTRLSMCRRTVNIYIFLMLLGISTLILSVVSIYQVTDKTVTDIADTYGSVCILKVIRDENNPDFWRDVEIAHGGGTVRAYTGPNVTVEMLDRVMAEVDGIMEYETGRDYRILLWDYELLWGYFYNSYLYQVEHPEKKWHFSAEDTKDLQYMTWEFTVCNSQNLEEFKNGLFKLVEGRHINKDDCNVVIISKALAEKNHLKLGDTFRIEGNSLDIGSGYPIYSLGGMDATIIGLFELTYQQEISEYTTEQDILENWIVVDRQTGAYLDELYGYPNQLNSAELYTESPKELEKVMEQIQSLDWIDWKYYTVYKDDSEYSEAVKPLENINTMMIIGGFLIGLMGMVLIYVLTKYSVKKRSREMGILMALGISAKEIRRQIWKEYLLLTVMAFGTAFMFCMVATPVLSNGIYQKIHSDNKAKVYTEEEIEAAILRRDPKAQEMVMDQRQLQDNILPESMEVQMNVWAVLVIAGVELLVVLFFVDNAIDKTLKQKPMDILTMIR